MTDSPTATTPDAAEPPDLEDPLLAAARQADADDELAGLRERFELPDDIVYLDGNSLGPLPKAVLPAVTDLVRRQWGQDLITSWNVHDWWGLPRRVGDQLAGLIGAAPGQVVCGDSTSVQLFQAMVAACRLRPGRSMLLTDGANFPSDQYLADSVGRLLGLQVIRLHPSELAAFLAEHGAQVAAVSFSLVDYRTGELFDAAELTRTAHACGAVMVWDLCHAIGALPVALDEVQADLAVGCSYKYLNGGPGSPAFIYIAHRHQRQVELPLTGWNGHREPFGLNSSYVPAESIEQARIGTPTLLSMVALQAALSAFDGVSIARLRAKSLALTQQVIDFADQRLARFGVEVVTPRQPGLRGSQVSLRMPEAYSVCQALIERGVIGDFRAPDLLRLGFPPMYLSFTEVHRGMQVLAEILADGSYREPRFARRAAVT
ncbi:kynureninase [Jatrophihabitans sp.]|uniref:kynureninase n=1 Tax=Jatrophihabitans sp. TaxID=1932789 RepID=UPI002CDF64B3|nr:kynureninase [Jatrophihabitans sp.]